LMLAKLAAHDDLSCTIRFSPKSLLMLKVRYEMQQRSLL
jgi:hypothetical protein